MKRIEARVPAGISSFFAICDTDSSGKPLQDPLKIGAIGGGFKVLPPVKTAVEVEEADKTSIRIYVNGKPEEASTSLRVAEKIFSRIKENFNVTVYHEISEPIGAGFGTSGAGALSLAVALSRAVGLNITLLEAAQIAHVAEVEAKTGLGTVGGLLSPASCVITRKPGAPGIGLVDGITVESEVTLIAVYFGPILTKHVLTDPSVRKRVNSIGWSTLHSILKNPSLECFLSKSMEFARESGFLTPEVERVVEFLRGKEGVIGYAQNMLGNCLHIVVEKNRSEDLIYLLKEKFKKAKVLELKPTTLTVELK